MERVELYHGHIVLEYENGGGKIEESLKATDPICTCGECECGYNGAIDGITSLILALACEGVDVKSDAFQRAVNTAVDKCGEEL
jgi:hypothetical protein